MSIARAFTTRRAKMGHGEISDQNKAPQRSNSARDRHGPILRHKISGPVQLVHTTNMLSYNAPDIPHALRSKSSLRSEDSEAPSTAESTPPTSPDVSPVEEYSGPQPNHLSTYFMVSDKPNALPAISEAPAIPQRSPSHTKQNSYDAIARQQSISRLSKDSDHSLSTKASFTFSRSSSTSTRASSGSYALAGQNQKPPPPPIPSPAPPASFQQRILKESHPFGQELAQVTELAEEYSNKATSKDDEEDVKYIKSNSLKKFSAEDYLGEINNLLSSFLPELTHTKPSATVWI